MSARLPGLTISLKKINTMAEETDTATTITIDGHIFEVVDTFTYLSSDISSTLSNEAEVSSRTTTAAVVMATLNMTVWSNSLLSVNVCVPGLHP